jgi:hypothetical protein
METTKVRIIWNGTGGQLDAVTAKNDGEYSLTKALIKLIEGNIVSPGDSFTVGEIEA